MRAAGAVIVGKTNVPELTLEGYTKNDLFGVTRNPWDTRLTPGGSSGGAAAGVAAGLVPAAIGTDGGGSIRRPACHTGLVGWKPSTGRIPRIDGFPAILTDFETIGTLTRTSTMRCCSTAPWPARTPATAARSTPLPRSGRRADGASSIIPQFGDAPVDPEVASVTAGVAEALAREGHQVQEEKVFFDLEDAARIWHVISRAGVAWLMGRGDGRLGAMAGASVRAMAADGAKLTGADYIDALERVAAFRRRCAELFARTDLVLTPTAAALPWPADTPYPDRIADRPAGPRDHAVFTGWVNIAGLPAISLPVAVSQLGLPIGVQFVAGFAGDSALLAFAHEFSRKNPPPPLPVLTP